MSRYTSHGHSVANQRAASLEMTLKCLPTDQETDYDCDWELMMESLCESTC